MAIQRQLSKAPAREALIDIQFEPRAPIEVIQELEKRIGVDFKQSVPIWEAVFGVSINSQGMQETSTKPAPVGIRFDSDEPPHVLQCRTQGFTFSRLSPYGRWEDLRDAAKKYWLEFVSIGEPFVVTRVAVRYINEIKLPVTVNDFADYLTCPPTVPANLPQAVSSFLHRTVIPDVQSGSTSIITQALEDQAVTSENPSVTVLLDVDVFRVVRIESTDTGAIWSSLDSLRVQKNHMFFEHITEKTLEMFL